MEEKQRGRPRVWTSAAAKQQEYRKRQAAQAALVADLLHAVRNARLEDPELQQAANAGDDAAVLRALTAYYQVRHWQRPIQRP